MARADGLRYFILALYHGATGADAGRERRPMRLLALIVLPSVASISLAQTCQQHWEAFGSGVTSDGYAAPMLVYNPGGGDGLYVGGSFSSVGGQLTRGIARWNPAT